MKADSILATIGNTPHIRLSRLFPDHEVWVKAERAKELIEATPGSWMPQQFDNPANIDVHVHTTAQEILADFADEPIDVLVTGVGTGGHLTGCAETLKAVWPGLKAYAVEPTLSPVISGGQPGPHPIQGIGAGFIPGNLHTQAIDGAIQVDPAAAKDWARRCATMWKASAMVSVPSPICWACRPACCAGRGW